MGKITEIRTAQNIFNETLDTNRFEHRYYFIPGFIHGKDIYPPWFEDRTTLFNNGIFVRHIHYNYFNMYYTKENIDYIGEPYALKLKIIDSFKKFTRPYQLEWRAKFPIKRMGDIFYSYTGVTRKRKKKIKKIKVKSESESESESKK